MSPTCLIVPLGEMAMNAIRSVTRVGLRMLSTTGVALLVLFGCPGDLSAVAMDEVVPADAPSHSDIGLYILKTRHFLAFPKVGNHTQKRAIIGIFCGISWHF